MTRLTEREKTFKSWCQENGGEWEIVADESRCKHPASEEMIKYEDPAFDRQRGDVVVPWSSQSDTSDYINTRETGGEYGDVEMNFGPEDPDTAISFVNRRDYEYMTVDFGEDGWNIISEGQY